MLWMTVLSPSLNDLLQVLMLLNDLGSPSSLLEKKLTETLRKLKLSDPHPEFQNLCRCVILLKHW
jgi:hypothetical protein